VLLVVEDNDLSVLTPTRDRRSWESDEVARGFGVPAVDIGDDPWLVRHHALELSRNLPALVNVRTCRALWHQGTGQDGPPEWDRWALVQKQLAALGLAEAAAQIVETETRRAEALWQERLQRRSAI
jgi:hypothetical protein